MNHIKKINEFVNESLIYNLMKMPMEKFHS